MNRLIRTAVAVAATAAASTFAVAAPAQAAASVTLTCEPTYHHYDCTANPSGIDGTIRWYVGGVLDSAFNDSIFWNRLCAMPGQVTVKVVYTDSTGSQATKTKTPSCNLGPTP